MGVLFTLGETTRNKVVPNGKELTPEIVMGVLAGTDSGLVIDKVKVDAGVCVGVLAARESSATKPCVPSEN
jgi:hypothetical protein